MYVKRNVYFSAVDQETGEEKLFSTTEIVSEETYQKEFGLSERQKQIIKEAKEQEKLRKEAEESVKRTSNNNSANYRGKSSVESKKIQAGMRGRKVVADTENIGKKLIQKGIKNKSIAQQKLGQFIAENPKKVLGGTAAAATIAATGAGYAGYKGVKKLTSKKD